MTIHETIEAFAGLRVLVIGEAMLDSYLQGAAARICREAPVPVVALDRRLDAPGGAANAAVNARALGAEVAFLSVVGADHEAELLGCALEAAGVATAHLLRDPSRQTLAKNRVIAGSQMLVRYDSGTTEAVSPEMENALLARVAALFHNVDAIVVSDYGYGILTPRVRARLGEMQSHGRRLIAVDAREVSAYRSLGVTAAKPNFDEVCGLLGEQPPATGDRAEWVEQRAAAVLRAAGTQVVAVTLDTEGAVILEAARPAYRTFARPAAQSRAAGAGDTYTVALALALAAGADTPVAAELASAASSVVVAKDGTSRCGLPELHELLSHDEDRVVDLRRAATRVEALRARGERIVFTNGCFDILHRGHVAYLNAARSMGDALVVGVNSDASVQRLKGAERPINPLEDRAQVLAALSCVDLIVPFEDDTPADIITTIRPDVFVKGGDYTAEMLPEAPLVRAQGGEVRILPYVEDRSTTGLIERIRSSEQEDRNGRPRRGLGKRKAGALREA